MISRVTGTLYDRGGVNRIFLGSDLSEPTIEADEVVVQDTSGSLFNDVSNPCYQYKGKYIITSLKSGLALIDQHRAHVRILFDQYITNIRQQRGASSKSFS